MSLLRKIFHLAPGQENSARSVFESLKDIPEYLEKVTDFLDEHVDLVDALDKALPWASALTAAVAEAVPPAKFLIKLFEALTKENDPTALGQLACTMAYQNAIAEAVKVTPSQVSVGKARKALKAELKSYEPSEPSEFAGFSFATAIESQFVKEADRVLWFYTASLGYQEPDQRKLLAKVHSRFVPNLKNLLSHGDLRERFAPFTQLMELGTAEQQADQALQQHADYQRWQFENAPVFGKEPFALQHVYVPVECGHMKWKDIRPTSVGPEKSRIDPFSETSAAREDLLSVVMELLTKNDPREPVVIQGVAGAGKSAFTLRLCVELLREGLTPIRVRLRDLRLDKHVTEVLGDAISLGGGGYVSDGKSLMKPEDILLGMRVFRDATDFRGTRICRYVLILDGWDEISISATEGFKIRVSKLLDEVRQTFLMRDDVFVRVILTGRPSAAVAESKFLRDNTPVLTIRTMQPAQLGQFVDALRNAATDKPVRVGTLSDWKVPDTKHFKGILERYKSDFADTTRTEETQHPDSSPSGSVAVLGLPLLAHLAVRLIALTPIERITALVQDSTTLYRNLIDLTCRRGKPADSQEALDPGEFSEGEFRDLLQRTAAAMTVLGQESISYEELGRRLDKRGSDLNLAAEQSKYFDLSSLLIGFFFKGGLSELGCEFVHKSFREYLFAERVITVLKEHGQYSNRDTPVRQMYWRDFDPADPRFQLSRNLSELMGPQWLAPEVARHVQKLLMWEIDRADAKEDVKIGTPTQPLSLEQWREVRNAVADLWDWWAEGVHMRPQPTRDNKRREIRYNTAYATDLVELSAALDPPVFPTLPEPKRYTTLDSHLGDGLFRVCSTVHFQIAVREGWTSHSSGSKRLPQDVWSGLQPPEKDARHCQSRIVQNGKTWYVFSPSGSDPRYFANYAHRINSAGWRPYGPFPLGLDLSGVDLSDSWLSLLADRQDVPPTTFTYANLEKAIIWGSILKGDFSYIYAPGAGFGLSATDNGADFSFAFLQKARFLYTVLDEVHFDSADLTGAEFDGGDISTVTWSGARLAGATFRKLEPPEEAKAEMASKPKPENV